MPRLCEHTHHACQGEQHWPVNVAPVFACVPPIVLLCALCVKRAPPCSCPLPSASSNMGICVAFVLHFQSPTELLLCLGICEFSCGEGLFTRGKDEGEMGSFGLPALQSRCAWLIGCLACMLTENPLRASRPQI